MVTSRPTPEARSPRPARRGLPRPRVALAAWCLWLVAALSGPALAGQVTIVDDPDVAPAAVEAVDRAVAATLDLFREEFGLTLNHDVRLVLTANKEDYATALTRQGGHSRDAAASRADKSVGMSSRGGMIVENLGRQGNLAEKIFVAAHELTHQFEDQASGGRHNAVRWLSEGTADYVAARVVETSKLGRLADYRSRWTSQVAASARPPLAALHGYAAWLAAESRFGGNAIYRRGDLAVLQLIDARGERALFDYFRKLRDRDPERAFREAFGQDLGRFEQQAE